MRNTEAPGLTPTPARGGEKQIKNLNNPKAAFLSAAYSMSWQLAIVVLVPVIGGYKLDQHFKITPVLTIVGFVIAIAGMVIILKRVLDEFSPSLDKRSKK